MVSRSFTGFSQANAEEMSRIRMFTPGGLRMDRLCSLSRFLSRQRARPFPAPVARFEHQACGLVFVYSAAFFVAAVYREAVHHPL
jgi:hypothetical protein